MFRRLFRIHISPLLLFVMFSSPLAVVGQTREWVAIHKANKKFEKEKYDEALAAYEKVLSRNPNNARALHNAGNAYLAKGDGAKAMELYTMATKLEQDPICKSRTFHNMGYVSQAAALNAKEDERQQLLREAIAHYKDALRLNPADDGARYNMELCRKQLKESKDDKNKKDNRKDNKPQQQQQQPPPPADKQQQQPQNNTTTQQLLNLSRQVEQKTKEKIDAARPRANSKTKNW